MKKHTIIFWITTTLIFLFEGVMPALTGNSELAKEGIRHLGYPEYFGTLLTLFKVMGAIGLMLPMIKGRLKEWVYAGFMFDFVFAFASLAIVDGFGPLLILPLICIIVLILSYRSYHKIRAMKVAAPQTK